jgi:hypothetical protein
MKKPFFGLLLLSLVLCGTVPGRAAGLTLTIRDGKVSLDAQGVTLRQILIEWARVGKTRIINLERVNSGPMTIQFEGVSEQQALSMILRDVPGYMAAPRATFVADASVYDRILIMATTTAIAARPSAATAFQNPSPNVTQLRAGPLMPLNPGTLPDAMDDPGDSTDPAIMAAAAAGLIAVPAPPPGAAGVNPAGLPLRSPSGSPTQPQMPTAAPATPANPWNAPIGTPQPGLAVPPPPPTTGPANRPLPAPRPPQPADR